MMHSPESRRFIHVLAASLLIIGAAAPSIAGPWSSSSTPPTAVDDFDLPVRPGPTQINIPYATLLANDTVVGSANITLAYGQESAPMYGSLTAHNHHFTYTPDPAFWSLGIDSFVYTLSSAEGSSNATAYLYALRDDELLGSESFEIISEVDSTASGGNSVTLTTDARAEGAKGLMVEANHGNAYASIDISGDGSTHGGLIRIVETCLPPAPPSGLSFLGVGGPDPLSPLLPPSVRLVMITEWEMRIEVYDSAQGIYHASQETVSFTGQKPTIEVDWYQEGDQIGALLRVNGEAIQSPLVYHPNANFDFVHVGVLEGTNGTSTTLGFDHLEWFAQRQPGEPSDSPIHFGDGFESGTLNAWQIPVGNDLMLLSQYEASGTFRLRDQALGTSYLSDDSPRSLSPYGDEELTVAFQLDLEGVAIPTGDGKTLYAFGANPLIQSPIGINLRLQIVPGSPHNPPNLLLRFIEVSTSTPSPTVPITSGVHHIAIQYRVSDDPEIGIGYARLWINGAVVTELLDLDNFHLPAAWSHLGANGGFPLGGTGDAYFDNFISAGRLPLASPAP